MNGELLRQLELEDVNIHIIGGKVYREITGGVHEKDVSYAGEILRNIHCMEVDFVNVDFSGADMRNVVFYNCTFMEACKFTGARLSGAYFLDAEIANCDFRGIVIEDEPFVIGHRPITEALLEADMGVPTVVTIFHSDGTISFGPEV